MSAYNKSTVVVYCIDGDIEPNDRGETRFLQAAAQNNMTTGDYMFLRLHFATHKNDNEGNENSFVQELSNKVVQNNFTSAGKDWYLSHVFVDGGEAMPFDDVDNSHLTPNNTSYFVDAVYTYARALTEIMRTTRKLDDSEVIASAARRQRFHGKTSKPPNNLQQRMDLFLLCWSIHPHFFYRFC